MSIRILHAADIHFCREHKDEALASLAVLRDTARERQADLVVIAGDLFDRGIQASERDAMPELLAIMRKILDIAPVVAVSGTPTHDLPGCYEVLTHLRAGNGFRLVTPGEPLFLGDEGWGNLSATLLILGCPEPGKDWLLANKTGLGSAEATQAVNEAMRGLLLGLGSIRREHPDIPCLMVYHGSVRGATMGSGQIVSGTELAIGAEDLALVGADYYALGHIHQGQQIGEMPAYYAGSAYPVDWGELDQKGCEFVQLPSERIPTTTGPRFVAAVERIPFPHPPRCKIVLPVVDMEDSVDHEVSGKQAWLVVHDTAEEIQREGVTEERAMSWLTLNGALPGSRVTFEPIPVETVRAGEISAALRLRDKVTVWAEASGLVPPTDPLREKANALEEEARATGAVGEGLHIRLRSLRLRGAIGVWKGLGIDEVTLNLDDYEQGLIALVGPNGVGKSTVIENLHPYGRMLTRSASLQSHFRLKDSCRELIFKDERSGATYRALILIDPTLSTPKAEYHLYQQDSEGWRPLTNGRREDYEAKIAELWGSIEMFARSAFVAQKPPRGLPDLADATPAERKALFRELGGLDYLQTYAESAKEKADALDDQVEIARGQADVIRPLLAQQSERQRDLGQTEATLGTAKAEVERVRTQGTEQKQAVEALDKRLQEQREIAQRSQALADEDKRLRRGWNDESDTVREAQTALLAKPEAAAIIQKADDLHRAEGALREEETNVVREQARLTTQHATALKAHRGACDELQAEQTKQERKAAELRERKAGLVAKVDALTEQIAKPLTETCPTCGQMLPEAKRTELFLARDQDRRALEGLQNQVLTLDSEIIDAERAGGALAKRREGLREPLAPTLPTFEQRAALDKVLAELETLDIQGSRETVRLADAAEAQIAAAEARQGQITARIGEIDREREALAGRIDPAVEAEHDAAKAKLDALREEYTRAAADVARLEAQIKGLRDILADLAHKRGTLAEIEQKIATAEAESADWRYLERACGRDGIQALELDALGPGICHETNALLEAYGSRFRVEIRTTRMAGKGSKVRSVEDFEIVIHDQERGTEQPLDTLSGGETVIVRKALYDAFGIIRAKNAGTKFLTVVLDEADGALDPEARLGYFRMLTAAHRSAGRAHTIVITHNETAQQMISQQIRMEDFRERGISDAGIRRTG
jgi:exonuclease SbcC